ncbi:UDP-2,3-diacylglucosamine diphosphatase [hydrothermal vent metagenome]|uniref:UDP-2,3-diacylglucosamine diphosphatase n=1 Tax=hydrothermal vent metagenome TaxID=652676 RepID=A0A3B0WI79_9ZZZZ
MKDLVFISDLHLAPERPKIIELFLQFADEVVATADELYILGDFLEYWLGDDDPSPALTPLFDKLIELSEQHKTKIFFMHGNRDFLIGNKLAERCHFNLINADTLKIKIHDQDVLLMHGDTLCIDDIEYQKFRQMVRSEKWQQDILSRSIEERIQIAKNIRDQSKKSTAEKDEFIMDVNPQETEKAFADNNVNVIIHGHTHRPSIHKEFFNNKKTTRIVLGDWFETGSYLRVNKSFLGDFSDCELQSFK